MKTKRKLWNEENNTQNTKSLQNDCWRRGFGILFVDHCSVIWKNNTCVHSLCACASNRSSTHKSTSTHTRIHVAFVIDICFLSLLFSNYFDVFWVVYTFFCFKRGLQGWSELQRCVLIYRLKRSAHFVWRLKQLNRVALISPLFFCVFFFLIRWAGVDSQFIWSILQSFISIQSDRSLSNYIFSLTFDLIWLHSISISLRYFRFGWFFACAQTYNF